MFLNAASSIKLKRKTTTKTKKSDMILRQKALNWIKRRICTVCAIKIIEQILSENTFHCLRRHGKWVSIEECYNDTQINN